MVFAVRGGEVTESVCSGHFPESAEYDKRVGRIQHKEGCVQNHPREEALSRTHRVRLEQVIQCVEGLCLLRHPDWLRAGHELPRLHDLDPSQGPSKGLLVPRLPTQQEKLETNLLRRYAKTAFYFGVG